MKTLFIFGTMFLLLVCNLKAQEKINATMPMIGDDAPLFIAETTSGLLSFPADYGSKWKIIFSHPQDFTPVCTTELLTLAHMQGIFEKLNTKLAVISTDVLDQHFMWKKLLEETTYKDMKPVKIKFPIIDDSKCLISKSYGMIHSKSSSTKDVRGVFIINPENKIAAVIFYPMNIGRNMEEIHRTLLALQMAESGKSRVLTPANWQPGDDVMVPYLPYTEKDLAANPSLTQSYYNVGSFMWFKKMKP